MRDDLGLGISVLAAAAFAVVIAGCSSGTWQFWKASSPPPTARPVVRATEPAKPAEHPSAAIDAEASMTPTPKFTPLAGLADVRFRPGQVTVAKADEKILDELVGWLKAHPVAVVLLEGHTDDLGTRESNLAAAESRAAFIKSYLVAQGIQPIRIAIEPIGSDRPLCVEKTDACRAKNRRVRFLVRQP
ncbi:MAG TPA: OmpA family protein [Methylomirabilota bacterium]|jgi:outer membrane protein OmpA-like peptidoglycan-associated protein